MYVLEKLSTNFLTMNPSTTLKVALAQIAPLWLDRTQTLEKILHYVRLAAQDDCHLVAFGEGLLPGYPYWVTLTDGAAFDSPVQKEIHAHYLSQAVQIERGDLDGLCALAAELNIAIYLGCIERPLDRGGHSLYCSLVYIDAKGQIQSVHRKLQPTYEERLTWAPGDGHGLRVHELGPFTLGGLNCWENWMPLPRTALYGLGENLHVAVWPGSDYNTRDITRFVAREGRSYVLSVSGLMRREDFPTSTPHLDQILSKAPKVLSNGGSCIAAPNGEWLIEPQLHVEGLITAELDIQKVWQERQNFDASGHYARPDVTRLVVNRKRLSILEEE